MSGPKHGPVAIVLPLEDWVHVANAVESSFQRKTKRGSTARPMR